MARYQLLRPKDWRRLAFAAAVIPSFWLGMMLAFDGAAAALATPVFAAWLLTRRKYRWVRWVLFRRGPPARRHVMPGYWDE